MSLIRGLSTKLEAGFDDAYTRSRSRSLWVKGLSARYLKGVKNLNRGFYIGAGLTIQPEEDLLALAAARWIYWYSSTNLSPKDFMAIDIYSIFKSNNRGGHTETLANAMYRYDFIRSGVPVNLAVLLDGSDVLEIGLTIETIAQYPSSPTTSLVKLVDGLFQTPVEL